MKSEIRPASAFRRYLPGDYRKKTVSVALDVAPYAASVNSYWDGGSRSDYTLFRDGAMLCVGRSPGFPRYENQTLQLLPGDVLVRTGVFCGKPATAHIMFIVQPAEVPALDSKEAQETFRQQRNADMGDVVRESLTN